MKSRLAKIAIAVLIIASQSACATDPVTPVDTNPAKPALHFVDLQGFDTDLASSLSTQLPRVEVGFYDRVTPNSLPLRLQTWLTSVDAGGGKVKITPPKSDITAKDPFLLLSLASSLWSASKLAKEAATKYQYFSAHEYDAEVVLKDDGKGQTVVDHIVFAKRAR